MKRPTEELLDDLLDDAAPPEFRAELMKVTLRQARRRKQVRQFASALVIAVVAGGMAFLFWKPGDRAMVSNQGRPAKLAVVPVQVISTRPDSVAVVTTSGSTLSQVETRASERSYSEINDQQLFALLAGHPAALVHAGPNQSELIFLNPEDRTELFDP